MTAKLIVLACLLAVANSRSIANFNLYFSTLSSRIIGGHDAKPGEFPHQVSLQLKYPKIGLKDLFHFCGGSILNNKWILTAAHCLAPFENGSTDPDMTLIVKAGKHDLNSNESSEQISVIDKLFVHESFELYPAFGALPYDVGLIKLQDPLRLNKRVAPISLPKKDTEPTGKVTLSGWGAINDHFEMSMILQTADLEIVDLVSCNQAIRKWGEKAGHPLPAGVDLVAETNICSGPMTDGKAFCGGDSGGPLISRDSKGKIEVVGIVSWSVIPCGAEGAPSVYTRTSAYIDWIENILSKN